jgi:singapore isolate B (sub-type 7) whole genome shotgun sequence assembly, scaffold_3
LFATNGALQIKTSWQEKEERRKRLQRTKELEKSITERRIEEKRVHIDHLKLSM